MGRCASRDHDAPDQSLSGAARRVSTGPDTLMAQQGITCTHMVLSAGITLRAPACSSRMRFSSIIANVSTFRYGGYSLIPPHVEYTSALNCSEIANLPPVPPRKNPAYAADSLHSLRLRQSCGPFFCAPRLHRPRTSYTI